MILENSGLIEGAIFFLLSIIYFLFPPKEINKIYGYRTSLSKKNALSWTYANKLASKICLIGSVLLLIITLSLNYFFSELNGHIIYFLVFLMLILFLYIFVEIKLKQFCNKIKNKITNS